MSRRAGRRKPEQEPKRERGSLQDVPAQWALFAFTGALPQDPESEGAHRRRDPDCDTGDISRPLNGYRRRPRVPRAARPWLLSTALLRQPPLTPRGHAARLVHGQHCGHEQKQQGEG